VILTLAKTFDRPLQGWQLAQLYHLSD